MAVIRLMRPFGILLAIFCALTTAAAADPIDGPTRPAPEVKAVFAPATDATGVAVLTGLTGAPRAADPATRSRPGNPLWAVPLTALAATRDRPLFSVSRRPPIIAAPIAAAPPKQEALAPPPPERPSLTLVGTIVSRKKSLAVLQGSTGDAVSRLRVGQENDGWLVRGIGLRSIIVEKGEQSVELGLPKPNGAPAE